MDRAMALSEVYACPTGLGWHLRVAKSGSPDQRPELG
jgi:hypothetical protein